MLNQTLPGPSTAILTLVDLLDRRAQEAPNGLAYRFLEDGTPASADTITYAELQRRARAIASLLSELDCQGERVLLLYPAGLGYIAAFFGCLYAGAVAVPAYPPRPNRSLDRLQAMIEDAQAKVALSDSNTLEKLERRLSESPVLKSLYWLSTDDVADHLADQWQPPVLKPDTLALLQYTSGSTALPKGVMISHDNLLHNSELIRQCFQNTPESRGVSWLPPYHDMGLVGGILQPLYVGAETTLMAPVSFLQRPMRWLEAISHYRASTSGGPNFAYELCLRKATSEQLQELDLSCWTLAFTGAEPIHQSTLDNFAATFAPSGFRGHAFYPCYGMAETTLMITGKAQGQPPQSLMVKAADLQFNQVFVVSPEVKNPSLKYQDYLPQAKLNGEMATQQRAVQDRSPGRGTAALRTLVGCGQPAVPDQVCIVNPDTQQPCPEDMIGEIWVRWSRSVALGYWQQPEATACSFEASLARTGESPMLRTGDLGFLHGNELYVTGRLKDLIIIRGRNHYPQDIEATVEQSHPALRQGCGAAFAIMQAEAEQLIVIQELERSALRTVDSEEVITAIRRAVAQHHELQVGAVGLLKTNAIPKTSSGKIQRNRCRAEFLQGQLNLVYLWQADESPTAETDHGLEADSPIAGQGTVTGDGVSGLMAEPPPQYHALSTPKAIEQWMVTWLSAVLKVPVKELDVRKPFAEHGLDSLTAVQLTEALEQSLGVSLSPTLAYEYPTIEALSVYLADQGKGQRKGPPLQAKNVEDTEVTQLVGELELLSDAEIQSLLGTESIEWS